MDEPSEGARPDWTDATDNRWLAYLYEHHDAGQLSRWVRSLRYFRFCRAYGGHANDGDQWLVALRILSSDDLVEVCRRLGISLRAIGPDEPLAEPGRAYTGEEFQRFPWPMRSYPPYEQPGWVSVAEQRVYAHVDDHRHHLTLAVVGDDRYVHTDDEVHRAQQVETLIASEVADRVVDPPQDNRNCLCPRYYPEIFA